MSGIRTIPQACAVPFRFSDRGLEFCLITARKSGRWGFPKGGIRRNETASEAAIHEALEEAGLEGQIVGPSIGSFEYSKQQRQLNVTVLLMSVVRTHEWWQESGQRLRQWATVQEAREMLDRSALQAILQSAISRLKRQSGDSSRVSAAGA